MIYRWFRLLMNWMGCGFGNEEPIVREEKETIIILPKRDEKKVIPETPQRQLTDMERLQAFLDQDNLDQKEYVDSYDAYRSGEQYHCCHFSSDLCRRAQVYFGLGDSIKVYPTIIIFKSGGAQHAINAAQIDNEWVFFDGMGDRIYKPDSSWKSYSIGTYIKMEGYGRGCRLQGVFVWKNL